MKLLLAEDEKDLSRALLAILTRSNYSAGRRIQRGRRIRISGIHPLRRTDPGYYDAENRRPYRPAQAAGTGGPHPRPAAYCKI